MDNVFLDLDLYEREIDQFLTMDDIREFSEAYNFLDKFLESVFVLNEEYVEPGSGARKRVKETIANTKKTTKEVGSIAGAAVDIKSMEYRIGYTLIEKAISATVKLLRFIIQVLDNGLKSIISLADKVSKIPASVLAKINGDIELYITINDIINLYNKSVVTQIDDNISDYKTITSRKEWKSGFFFNYKTDIGLLNRIHARVLNIENAQFNPTKISMKDKSNIEKYLAGTYKFKFRGLDKQEFEGTYYEALKKLLTDLNSKHDVLVSLQDGLSQKFERSKEDTTYSNLPIAHQNIIKEGILDISKTIKILGGIIKSVTTDINTIDKAVKKIDKYLKKTNGKSSNTSETKKE